MTDLPETTKEAVQRVQAWLADEREAGRCVFDIDDVWIAQLLRVAAPLLAPVDRVARTPFSYPEDDADD
jgi:hypothetical protein